MNVEYESERRWRDRVSDFLERPSVRSALVGFLVFGWAAAMGYVAGYRAGRDER